MGGLGGLGGLGGIRSKKDRQRVKIFIFLYVF